MKMPSFSLIPDPQRFPRKTVDDIVAEVQYLYCDGPGVPYVGAPVTELQHCCQAAANAANDGVDEETIIAALLHDIGWKLINAKPRPSTGNEEFNDFRVVTNDCMAVHENVVFFESDGQTAAHDKIGAQFLLKIGFSQKIADLVGGHVAAKRYLTATDPAYHNRLSDSSKKTLKFQGGPMSPLEAEDFERNPNYKGILQLRLWDEKSKIADLVVPTFDSYLDMMKHCLELQRTSSLEQDQ